MVLERDLEREVLRLLGVRPSLLWHHCADARRCRGERGFPDLVVFGVRTLFRELKGSDTPLRLHQSAYGRRLVDAGCDWAVWRPDDLESGRIAAELDLAAGRAAEGVALG